MSEIKNHGKSIKARLLNVAKQEEVFYQTILTRYFQERLLYRISQTRYRENFYLKGYNGEHATSVNHTSTPTIDDFLTVGTKAKLSPTRCRELYEQVRDNLHL